MEQRAPLCGQPIQKIVTRAALSTCPSRQWNVESSIIVPGAPPIKERGAGPPVLTNAGGGTSWGLRP
eukprot:11204990-Lingulodinium_polyedra.AAC.1